MIIPEVPLLPIERKAEYEFFQALKKAGGSGTGSSTSTTTTINRYITEPGGTSVIENITRGNTYYPNSLEVDQGQTGEGETFKAFAGLIGSENGTLFLKHDSGGEYTNYIFDTDLSLGSNIVIEIENGARIVVGSGKELTILGFFESGLFYIFTGDGKISFGDDKSLREIYSVWWGGAGDNSTDNSPSLLAASKAIVGGIIWLPSGRCIFNSKVAFGDTASRGAYTIKGYGATYHLSAAPTTAKGTTVIWDGSATDTLFEFGDDPLYIAGVSQGFDNAQFNNQLMDFSIIFTAGITSVVYAHDQDGLQLSRMYIDGQNRKDIKGVIDCRGTINNMRFQQVTIANVPNGYGIRCGDGSVNNLFDQVYMGNVALAYWIGDTLVYEDPYQNGITSWKNCTFEGFTGVGKFSVNTLNAGASAAATTITVVDGSLFATDDPVYIDRLHDKFEMNRVESVAGDVLTLTYPLEYSHSSGAIIKAGRIGVHAGKSSTATGRTTNLSFEMCMWDKYGCCLDVHNIENINIDHPIFVSNMQRGIFFDGDVQNITLTNPRVLSGQLPTWLLFEITNRGNTFNFNWWGGVDKSGVVTPYLNSQGELDGFYIGSFQQTASDYPNYFRGITFDSSGVIIRETSGAAGLKYQTGANINFEVTPGGLGKFNDGIDIYNGAFTVNTSGQTAQAGYSDYTDIGEPGAPAATKNRFFFERWGGKGHLYVKFPTGAKQLIASEP